jgi:hypothetical protein
LKHHLGGFAGSSPTVTKFIDNVFVPLHGMAITNFAAKSLGDLGARNNFLYGRADFIVAIGRGTKLKNSDFTNNLNEAVRMSNTYISHKNGNERQ